MTDLLLSVNAEEKNDDLHVCMFEYAINYFNNHFGTNLRINFNYKGQNSGDAEVQQILDVVAGQRRMSCKKATMEGFKAEPVMRILTRRLTGNSRGIKCTHGAIWYCESQMIFRQRFYGSNIYAIFAVEDPVKCFLCEQEMKKGTLNAHFENDCGIFNPAPVIGLGVYANLS